MFAPSKNTEMANEEMRRSARPGSNNKLQAMRHIAMGVMYLIFAILMFYMKKFGAIDLSAGLAYSLGSLLLLYGAFRLWRGFADLKELKNNN